MLKQEFLILPLIEEYSTYPRDLSWLSFNYRVLQEAMDESVPLFERLRFLAIYANNLEEFYRVRMAHHSALARLGKKTKAKYDLEPERMIRLINDTVNQQQREFDSVFFHELIPALKERKIEFADENFRFTKRQLKYLDTYFADIVKPLLNNSIVDLSDGDAFLLDKYVYLCVALETKKEPELHLIRMPVVGKDRMINLPAHSKEVVIFFDDIVRLFITRLFKRRTVIGCWAIKISRDAELYLEDEFEGNIVEKIKKSVLKRQIGLPTRMMYDSSMPVDIVEQLSSAIGLETSFTVPGSRYQNFYDLLDIPFKKRAALEYKKWPPVRHPKLLKGKYFKSMKRRNFLLSFPYHSYDHILELLNEAAEDPSVESIFITLYRVAHGSKVSQALIRALKNGKQVTVFDEVKARFDEETNIYYGEKLKKAGAEVVFSFDRIKVHCKVLLIEKKNGSRYAALSTGNFNEKTAKLYCDHSLLTSDPIITKDLVKLKRFLAEQEKFPNFKKLLVAPNGLRSALETRIAREIRIAARGGKGRIWLKLNSLEDVDLIERLYDASNAGVEIKLIIRGICCLIPGIKGQSENIKIVSIVDRYLEHSRVYIFGNNGDPRIYISSADIMRRNLNGRVEVAVPVELPKHKKELQDQFRLQWNDGTKARRINLGQTNNYRKLFGSDHIGSQQKLYERIVNQAEK